MSYLAIDTATLTAGVGLLADERLYLRRGRVTSHSDELLQMVSDVVAESGGTVRQLRGVICGAGPGSFTGLRIGLATCKGLALSVGCPLLLVSSLAALAARAPDGPCLAILDAYKDEVYVVVSGSGQFVCGDTKVAFGPGDALFVPAHAVHRFEAFTDDFATWVVFYGPTGGESP